jgi:hypothetical protein
MSRSRTLISILILLVIGLHVVPALRRGQTQTLWPFLKWSMYKDSRPPGPIEADIRRVMGTTQRGETQELTPEMVGLQGAAVGRLYIQPMMSGDSSAAPRLMSRVNAQRQDPFVELSLRIERFALTDTGIVKQVRPPISYRSNPSQSR